MANSGGMPVPIAADEAVFSLDDAARHRPAPPTSPI
jgi:hypothetical protein